MLFFCTKYTPYLVNMSGTCEYSKFLFFTLYIQVWIFAHSFYPNLVSFFSLFILIMNYFFVICYYVFIRYCYFFTVKVIQSGGNESYPLTIKHIQAHFARRYECIKTVRKFNNVTVFKEIHTLVVEQGTNHFLLYY